VLVSQNARFYHFLQLAEYTNSENVKYMNFSGCLGYMTIQLNACYCMLFNSRVKGRARVSNLGLDLVSGWLVVIHTY